MRPDRMFSIVVPIFSSDSDDDEDDDVDANGFGKEEPPADSSRMFLSKGLLRLEGDDMSDGSNIDLFIIMIDEELFDYFKLRKIIHKFDLP